MTKYRITRAGLTAVVTSFLLFSACDSVSDDDLRVSGRVTDEAGAGKAGAFVEGATVTAASVQADGDVRAISGSTTTNASGAYTLSLESNADVLVVAAARESFETSTLVYAEGRSSVDAMPMTTETDAEADVYIEARSDANSDVTLGDVAFYVTSEVAAEIASGAASAAQVAARLEAAAQAEAEYAERETGSDESEEVEREERRAFAQLQADLAASVNAGDQEARVRAFERAYTDVYTESGISANTQARARLAARTAISGSGGGMSSTARFRLEKQAEVLAALATGTAIEASLRALDASSARVEQAEEARVNLATRIRTAASSQTITDARAAYRSDIEAIVAAETGVNASTIAGAYAVIQPSRVAMEAGLATAANATAIARLYAEFFSAAEAALTQALGGSADASVAANALVLLSVQ